MARGDMAARLLRREGLEPEAPRAPSPSVQTGGTDLQTQMAAAERKPRSLAEFRRRIDDCLTYDPDQIVHLLWTREVDGKMGRGPSVRLAELMLYAWGNSRSIAQVTSIGRDYVEAEGVCLDVETNTATAITLRRSTRRIGRRMSHEEVLSAATAAGSVARRNAILACIPQLVWGAVVRQVEDLIAGDEATLAERREALVADLAERGVTQERICLALGVNEASEIDRNGLVTLHGLVSALTDGGGDPDELLPDPTPPTPEGLEGFSVAHVAAETGTPIVVAPLAVALGEPEATLEPEAAPEEPVDPVRAWMDAFRLELDQAPDRATLDAISDALSARLEGRESGLALAARAALSKRRREMEAPKPAPRDETVDLFEALEEA